MHEVFVSKNMFLNTGGRIDRILKRLVFYGHIPPSTWFTSFPTRIIFLEWLDYAISCCCVSLDRLDLINLNRLFQPHTCVLFVGLGKRCPRPLARATLASLVYWKAHDPIREVHTNSSIVLGFMMLDATAFPDLLMEITKFRTLWSNNTAIEAKVGRLIDKLQVDGKEPALYFHRLGRTICVRTLPKSPMHRQQPQQPSYRCLSSTRPSLSRL